MKLDMTTLLQTLSEYNWITVLLLVVLLGSVLQGLVRGASRSAGRLFALLSGGVLSLVGIAVAVPLTMWVSPKVQVWLSTLPLPERELARWEQVLYTLIMAVRDFPLMRFAVVFLLLYWLIRTLAGFAMLFFRGGAACSAGYSPVGIVRLPCLAV